MFCRNCGSEILEGAKFCTSCGAPASDEQANAQNGDAGNTYNIYEPSVSPEYTYAEGAQPQDEEFSQEKYNLAGNILGWAIAGAACAASFCAAPLGIIFSALTLNKFKKYNAMNGKGSPKAKVGRGIAIGGLVYGIVATVLMFIMFIAWVYILRMVLEEGVNIFDPYYFEYYYEIY